MSSEIPIIVTQFRDFDLEERVVRLLAHRGFRIGERKIMGARELGPEEILITDEQRSSEEIPLITLPIEAWQWSEIDLQRFLQHQLLPPPLITDHLIPAHRALIIGGENEIEVREDLLASLHESGAAARFASFDESDLRSALIPTRRMTERLRFDHFARAEAVLFLLGLPGVDHSRTERNEIARAQSLIEYRRRVHPHLRLGFALIGGRKSKRKEISALFEPFSIFLIEDMRDDLVRIWPRKRMRGSEKFREIEEWIGSPRGDSRQSSDLQNRAPSRGARSSRRIGGAVATSR